MDTSNDILVSSFNIHISTFVSVTAERKFYHTEGLSWTKQFLKHNIYLQYSFIEYVSVDANNEIYIFYIYL
jgi:hypothetical protein